MNNYTPTTEQMHDVYVRADIAGYKPRKEYEAEFDRWLDQVRAEAWDEGHNAGQHNEHEYRPRRAMTNPYRQETES